MAQPFDVCIRGAGIVGRSLALLLAQHRLRVGLVQAPRLSLSPAMSSSEPPDLHDNRAYALNAASRQLLQGLRCWPEGMAVTPVTAMRVRGDEGGEVNFAASVATPQPTTALAWIVEVAELESCLANAIRFQPQIEVIDAPQPAGLTVVCEGRFSSTRDELGVDFDVASYGQHAIAARFACEQPHQGQALQWFSQGEIMAFLPLQGPGGNSVALVWSVSESRAQTLMALSAEDFAAAAQTASACALGTLTVVGERAKWPLQHGQAQAWSGKTAAGQAWVLAGDAAHTVHPLGGQGLNLGLADVTELANTLGTRDYWRSVSDPRLLRSYERARRAGLAPVGAVMDGLQRLFAQPDAMVKNMRNAGMQGFEHSGPLKAWVARQAMGLN